MPSNNYANEKIKPRKKLHYHIYNLTSQKILISYEHIYFTIYENAKHKIQSNFYLGYDKKTTWINILESFFCTWKFIFK